MNLISFNEMTVAWGIGATLGVIYGEHLFLKEMKKKAFENKVILNFYNFDKVTEFAKIHGISRVDKVIYSGSIGIISAVAYAQLAKFVKQIDEFVHEKIQPPLNFLLGSGFGLASTYLTTKIINYSLQKIDPSNQPLDFLGQALVFWPGFIYYQLLHASDLPSNNGLE